MCSLQCAKKQKGDTEIQSTVLKVKNVHLRESTAKYVKGKDKKLYCGQKVLILQLKSLMGCQTAALHWGEELFIGRIPSHLTLTPPHSVIAPVPASRRVFLFSLLTRFNMDLVNFLLSIAVTACTVKGRQSACISFG